MEADLDLTRLVKAADLQGKHERKSPLAIEKWLRAGHCKAVQHELAQAVPDKQDVERALVRDAVQRIKGGQPYEAQQPVSSPFA